MTQRKRYVPKPPTELPSGPAPRMGPYFGPEGFTMGKDQLPRIKPEGNRLRLLSEIHSIIGFIEGGATAYDMNGGEITKEWMKRLMERARSLEEAAKGFEP